MKCFRLTAFFSVIITTLPSAVGFAKGLIIDKDQAISSAYYNWTGLYAGLNAGAVKHSMDITDNQAVTFNATVQEVTDPRFTGGFQFGYRRQLTLSSASGVFGLEFSAHFSDAQSSQEYGSPFALYQLNFEHKLKNVLLGELIAGIAADKSLLFTAFGLSWFHVSGRVFNEDGIPFFNEYSVGQKTLAVAIGGGAEYAISERLSARIKVDVLFPDSYITLDNADNHYTVANHIVQGVIGVNYRFS